MNRWEKCGVVFVGFLAIILVWLISLVIISLGNEAQCLKQGYPQAKVTWNYQKYCVGYGGVVYPVVVSPGGRIKP